MLVVVAAVIIGGTPLSGGYGTVIGAVVGMLIIQVISSGLIFFGIDATWSTFVTGAVIVLAVVARPAGQVPAQPRARPGRRRLSCVEVGTRSAATYMTTGILNGLSIVEGSAFVAVPLGGMTLAQLGADVIRFDPIGGGLDARRWPLDAGTAHSLFWAGLNKGKRSLAVDLKSPRGTRDRHRADRPAGAGRRHLPHQPAGRRLAVPRAARARSAPT